VEQEIKRELDQEKQSADACDDINSDADNDEEEYEAWKVRELKRIKRDREERETSVKFMAQIPLGLSCHVLTRCDTFDVSSPCILAVLSLSNSTARHAQQDELDWLDMLVSTSSTGSTRRA